MNMNRAEKTVLCTVLALSTFYLEVLGVVKSFSANGYFGGLNGSKQRGQEPCFGA
jgi:hypothetical protein